MLQKSCLVLWNYYQALQESCVIPQGIMKIIYDNSKSSPNINKILQVINKIMHGTMKVLPDI